MHPATASQPDEVYLRDVCGGVPAWEVSLLIHPPHPEHELSQKEHESLILKAEQAREDGLVDRAYMLAERAYAGRRSVSTLLYLLDIRVRDMGDAAFGAAAYHSALRMLDLTGGQRNDVQRAQERALAQLRERTDRAAAERIAQRAEEVRLSSPMRTPTGSLKSRAAESSARAKSALRATFASEVDEPSSHLAPPRRLYEDDDRRAAADASMYSRPPPVHVPQTPSSVWSAPQTRSTTAVRSGGMAGRLHTPYAREPPSASYYHEDSSDDGGYPSSSRYPPSGYASSGYPSSGRPSSVGYPSSGRPSSVGVRVVPRTPAVPAHVADAFHFFDVNRTGYLDHRELRHALRRSGIDLSSEGARSLVMRYDDHPDGKLDLAEFAELADDIQRGIVRPVPGSAYGPGAVYAPEASAHKPHKPSAWAEGTAWQDGAYLDGGASRTNTASSSSSSGGSSFGVSSYGGVLATRAPSERSVHFSPRDSLAAESDLSRLAARASRAAAAAKPLRVPLISPLIPRRPSEAHPSASEARFGRSHRDPLPRTDYYPRNPLEEWLDGLPGLEPVRPPPLLGVRPLERAEAIARFLRLECTLWEAQQAYLDSHRLYLRQWMALQLQALYRGREARREAHRLRNHTWFEQRMKSALGFWRNQIVTRCFFAWVRALEARKLAFDSAKFAVVRMYANRASRAFNQWKYVYTTYCAARSTLEHAARLWSDNPRARAFRSWRDTTTTRRDAERIIERALKAALLPELRYALNAWQARHAARVEAQALMRKVVGIWGSYRLAVRFRQWKRRYGPTGRRSPSSGAKPAPTAQGAAGKARHEEHRRVEALRALMSRPCVKQARYTAKWRAVELSLSPTHFTYSSGGGQKVRSVSLSWIADVQGMGPARIRHGPFDACWRWQLVLTPFGRQHAGAKVLTFGTQSQEAMGSWIDAVRQAAPNVPSTAPGPQHAPASGAPPSRPAASPLRPLPTPTSRANAGAASHAPLRRPARAGSAAAASPLTQASMQKRPSPLSTVPE